MRQPMEDKVVTISRAKGSLTFSANFQLIAAMNPCPCGYFGDSQKPCTCAPAVVTKYQKRISGPILDRIDIHIEVPRVDYENSAEIDWIRPVRRFANVSKPQGIFNTQFTNNTYHIPFSYTAQAAKNSTPIIRQLHFSELHSCTNSQSL